MQFSTFRARFQRSIKSSSVSIYTVDITDRASIEKALEEVVKKWDPPNILVNAAAIDVPPLSGRRDLSLVM